MNKWYGCNYGSRDCVVGAVTKDSELKNMWCSNCNRVRPGDVLEVTTVLGTVCQYLFCGTVGKHFKAGLFYFRKYVTEPKGNKEKTQLYRVFQKGEMEKIYRKIRHIRLNPVQAEAGKRIAKKRKAKWLRGHSKNLKVLIACEESQAVCKEFRKLGHRAYSCDIEPCSGGHPEWHILGDVTKVLDGRCNFITQDGKNHYIGTKWDMIIAFPPCTYLSNAGARHLFRGGNLNQERYKKGLLAKEFFLRILDSDCDKISVENPVSSKIYDMPKCSQEIQPWQFGHPVQKKTRLWLKGLPNLKPTNIVDCECGCHEAGTWFMKGGKDRQKNRSKTFPGIAKAMAEQWGG